ncbi:DUF697 domain-containing protein [Halodesulfovibrio sp.]|uniref:DUF697 domain-containing protein n=1 Tax=Halodesulfovibrio sp. TaxID=1912772 RepID=UPI0025C1915A|nr:DUF697 domain-containing protein [Halodesulfovibrio sp.]
MHSKIKIILYLLGGIIAIALGSLLLSGIRVLADIAGYIDPTYVPVVFWTLTIAGCGLLGYAALTLFIFPKPLLLPEDPSEEQIQEYRKAYVDRLQRNPFLKSQKVSCKTEQEIENSIAALETEANRLIDESAKRVFIGTATAQNGRLDTLIVFALITHLIYKITKLYAQRPHVNDLITLYKNVAATAFFAGAMEDIVVEEYTQQIVGPLVATSVIGSIPGAQAVASVVTSSILDGSMNSLLTMRCGIIARNYMSIYTDKDLMSRKELRRSATREAAAMFMRTSGDTIATVAQLLISGASKTVKRGMTRAWDAVRNIGPSSKNDCVEEDHSTASDKSEKKTRLHSARKGVTQMASSATKGVAKAASSTTEGVAKAASSATKGVSNTAGKIAYGAATTGKTISTVSKNAASGVASGVTTVTTSATKGVTKVASSARKGVAKAASSTTEGVAKAASSATKGVSNIAEKIAYGAATTGKTISTVSKNAASGVASGVTTATTSATRGVTKVASSARKGGAKAASSTAEGGAKAASSATKGVSNTAEKIAYGAATTGKTISTVSKNAASGVASGVTTATTSATKGVTQMASSATKGGAKAASSPTEGGANAESSTTEGVANAAFSATEGVTKVASTAAKGGAAAAANGISSAASSTTAGVHTVGKKTAYVVSKTDASVKRGIKKSGKKIFSAASKAKKVLKKPFLRKKKQETEAQ